MKMNIPIRIFVLNFISTDEISTQHLILMMVKKHCRDVVQQKIKLTLKVCVDKFEEFFPNSSIKPYISLIGDSKSQEATLRFLFYSL